jgi:hypothetical protein
MITRSAGGVRPGGWPVRFATRLLGCHMASPLGGVACTHSTNDVQEASGVSHEQHSTLVLPWTHDGTPSAGRSGALLRLNGSSPRLSTVVTRLVRSQVR